MNASDGSFYAQYEFLILIVIVIDYLRLYSSYSSYIAANWFPLVNSSAYVEFYFEYLYDYSRHYGAEIKGKILKIFKDGRPLDNSSYSSLTLPLYFYQYFRLTFAPVTSTDSGIYKFDVQIRPRYSSENIRINRLSLHEHLEIRGVTEKK